MQIPKVRDTMLPLMILAFVGLAVTFLTPIFNATSRWAILGIVGAYLLSRNSLWRPIRSIFGLLTLVFALWALATTAWSEVPTLSGLKAIAFLIIVFICMAAGQLWVYQHHPHAALDFLLPLMAVSLLAGLLGHYSTTSIVVPGPDLYQGLVNGPNMYGSMLAMCSPFLLWRVYSCWNNRRQRAVWLAINGIALYYLLAANSRSAFLVVMFTMLGLFLSLRTSRKLHLSILCVGLLTFSVLAAPGVYEQIQYKYIYKHAPKGEGILYTRDEPWRISYEQAQKGGWIGGGYGVTIGETGFEGGLTAVGYGREKGNSQLAIIEETGLIGFAIYLFSLLVLFHHLMRRVLRWPVGKEKALLGTVVGALFGMVMQSVFEAWWVAPSSPESVYFWSLAGVALALSRLRLAPAKQPKATEQAFGESAPLSRAGHPPAST